MATPLPGPLRLSPAFAFAGRANELSALRALLPRAAGEGRRAVLVSGDPGSGKSRLVRELAHQVADEGATVLYGDCDAVVGSPYAPFAGALEHLVHHTKPDVLRAYVGAGDVDLTRLLPGFPAREARPAMPDADADRERHRLHTAVTDLLTGASTAAPLLLVLEDVHWADSSTIQLLRHLVRSGSAARMLLVATFRDAESDIPAALSDALVDVYRSEGVTRIRLGALTADEVAEFVRLSAGVAPAGELTSAMTELTGGNAFLLTELWRALLASGAVIVGRDEARLTRPAAALGTPATVREVVNQRVTRLSAGAAALLELAAVAGAEFELDTVRRTDLMPEAELLDAVDEGVRDGLLVEEPGRRLAYRFAHELVRRAVADRLSAQRRAQLHLRVAEALEAGTPHLDSRASLAALAYHYAAAAPLGGVDRAVDFNLLAAESAVRALAFDEAQDGFRTALELGLRERHHRAEVMLQLGDACHRAGHADAALETFSQAAEIGRAVGDADVLARAAIGFEEACWRPAIHDSAKVELLEEAAAALGSGDSQLRARVLGGLARALDLRGDSARAALARDESIAMSRRRGDRHALAATLAQAYWARGSSENEEVNGMLREALELGEELESVSIQGEALAWLVPSYVVLCDHDAARDSLAKLFDAARRLSEPFLFHVAEHYAAAIALADGDLTSADDAAARSQEWAKLMTGRDASGTHGIQMFGLRREQGRLAELAPVVRLLDADARDGGWRPGLAVLLAELGMHDDARLQVRRTLEDGIGSLRQSLWLGSLVYLADATAALGEVEAAGAIYPELLRYEGGNVMIGHLVACYGAADRYLGMTASVLRDWDRAEQHFRSALALNMKLGARTWLAHTAFWYARMLLERGTAEDRLEARGQLGVALGLAQAIGLPTLAHRVTELGTSVIPAPVPPDGLSVREVEILVELARGRSNREIGNVLHISEHTAANHIRSILRKTGCANRTEAAGYALRRGLVPD